MTDFAVTVADCIHFVHVDLTTARVGEETHAVHRPALYYLAVAVLSCCYIVEGVVGRLPVKHDHIAGAIVSSLRISWSAGDWRNEKESQTSMITGDGIKAKGQYIMCQYSG